MSFITESETLMWPLEPTKKAKLPAPPVVSPAAPVLTKGSPEVDTAKARERRRLRGAQGFGGTILTPGFLGPASVRKQELG